MKLLLFLFLLLLIIWIKNSDKYFLKENFAWECNWKPNKNYYKEDWLLGNDPAANAMARDAIKQQVNH